MAIYYWKFQNRNRQEFGELDFELKDGFSDATFVVRVPGLET